MKSSSALALAVLCTFAYAEPTLDGRWQSDQALAMRFAERRAKLDDRTTLFLSQALGRLTIEFSKGIIKSSMPSWENVRVDGTRSHFAGFIESHPFKVLAATADQVAVLSQEPVSGTQRITVYNFEGADTMWVYLAGTTFSDMNIREYFVRVR